MRPVVGEARRGQVVGGRVGDRPVGRPSRRAAAAVAVASLLGSSLIGVFVGGRDLGADSAALGSVAAASGWLERTPDGLTVHSTLTAAVPDGSEETSGPVPTLAPSGGSAPIVGVATATGRSGWWEAAADGSVFALGGAPALGSVAATPLA